MMILSQRHVDIIEALYGLNIDLARGDDDKRRQLTKKIAEQFCFEFGPRWGTKSTTVNHPQSKDALAYKNDDGSLDAWDWQNGTTREPQVRAGKEADYKNLNHHFIAVQPVNHLSSVPENGNETEDDPNLTKIVEVLAKILDTQQTILENQVRLSQAMQVLIDKPTPEITLPPIKFPEYKASTFLGTITLKPQV